MAGLHFGRGYPFQIEQGEPEGRREEGSLQVHRDQDAEPQKVDPEGDEDGRHHRHDDVGDLDEIDEEAGDEDHDQDQGQEGVGTQVGVHDQAGHVRVALHAPEHQSEGLGPHQHEEDHARDVRAFLHDLLQRRIGELALEHGEQGRAQRAHGGRFRRRGDAREDGAQHDGHEAQGEQEGPDDLSEHAAFPERRQFLGGHGRGLGRFEHGHDGDPDQIQAHQDSPGNDGADEHVADRHVEDAPEEHEHHAGRDDLSERPRRGDRARRHLGTVAAPEHGGQAEQAHGHDRRPHDTGGCAQQRAHDHDRHRESAPQPAEEQGHGLQHVLGQAGLLQHHAHVDEERHGEEDVVRHDAPDAQGQQVEEVRAEGHEPEQHGHAAEGEGHRVPHQEQQEEDQEEDERHRFGQTASSLAESPRGGGSSSSPMGSSPPWMNRSRERAARASPCRRMSVNPMGIMAFRM